METTSKVIKKRTGKKKEIIPLTGQSYAKIAIVATTLFLVARASAFKGIFPFGIAMMLGLIMCDRKNIGYLPIGLAGIFSTSMNAYIVGSDLLVMSITSFLCFLLSVKIQVIDGTRGRIKKNREQILLILMPVVVVVQLTYHYIMDVVLAYDVIMAVMQAGIILTFTFVFTLINEDFKKIDISIGLKKIGDSIYKLKRRKKDFIMGIAIILLAAFVYQGIREKDILAMDTVYILFGGALLLSGYIIGSGAQVNLNKQIIERIKHGLMEYSEIFEKLQLTYGRAIERNEPVSLHDYNLLTKNIKDNVCSKCNLMNDCWNIYEGRAKRYMAALVRDSENRMSIEHSGFDEKYGFACKKRSFVELCVSENVKFTMNDYKWQKKIERSREAMAIQFRGIARSIFKMINDLEVDKPFLEKRVRSIGMDAAVSCSAKSGEVSGDSHLCKPLSATQHMIAISDGMGSGEKAGAESFLTVNTLYDFMRAGFDVELALNAMNAMLLIKTTEEIFSTVDLAVVDLEKSKVKFYKIGASMAFIKRGDIVTAIKQATPPMGIIDRIQVEDIDVRVTKGDVVIMASDGITEADRDDLECKWLEDTIRGISSKNPQTIADLINKEAAMKYGQRERDDMTVVAILIN